MKSWVAAERGTMIEAKDLVSQITSCGYNPDVITYNSLISGYSNVGNVQKCLSLYENMKKLGIKPTLDTYHPLISACSEEDMLLADYLFYDMLGMGLSPDQVGEMIDRGIVMFRNHLLCIVR